MAAPELLLESWGRLWGVPDLASRVRVRFEPRLRRSLGRCRPADGRIALHPDLRESGLLSEVLCHEAAHVAAHLLHGPGAKPHGAEWRGLVEAAGHPAAVRLRFGDAPPPRRSTSTWVHRCPVCQMERTARRPVPVWRCRACVEAGLDGALVVERRP